LGVFAWFWGDSGAQKGARKPQNGQKSRKTAQKATKLAGNPQNAEILTLFSQFQHVATFSDFVDDFFFFHMESFHMISYHMISYHTM
jgi:hypothetical protein